MYCFKCFSGVLHSSVAHWWSNHRLRRHASSHRSRLRSSHVDHHCRCRKRRLYRNADVGRRRWHPASAQWSASTERYCTICTFPRFQESKWPGCKCSLVLLLFFTAQAYHIQKLQNKIKDRPIQKRQKQIEIHLTFRNSVK